MDGKKFNTCSFQEKWGEIISDRFFFIFFNTVKLGNKEQFDKEQIGIKEPFPVTDLPFTS